MVSILFIHGYVCDLVICNFVSNVYGIYYLCIIYLTGVTKQNLIFFSCVIEQFCSDFICQLFFFFLTFLRSETGCFQQKYGSIFSIRSGLSNQVLCKVVYIPCLNGLLFDRMFCNLLHSTTIYLYLSVCDVYVVLFSLL